MEQQANPDMKGIVAVIFKWRRYVIALVLITTIAGTLAALLGPKKYISRAIIFPSNSFLTDKGHLFNKNIQQLYSPLGTSDDLDHLYAIASSSTVFSFITDSLHMVDHYNVERTADSQAVATKMLKKKTTIIKSENGELRIEAWDRDNNIAAAIVAAMLSKIQSISNDFIIQSNTAALQALKESKYTLTDSSNENKGTQSFEQQLKELEVNLKAIPPAFVILEKPFPSLKSDTPEIWLVIVISFLAGLVFAIIAVLIAERFK